MDQIRCISCGKEIESGYFNRYGEGLEYYCSLKCFRSAGEEVMTWGKKLHITCEECGRSNLEEGIFYIYKDQIKYFCSLDCYTLHII